MDKKDLDENYVCPICKRGILELKEFYKIQTSESKENDVSCKQDSGDISPIQEYYCDLKLKCNKCNEIVLCSGNYSDSLYYEDQDEFPNDRERIFPKIFLPTLDIIDIPNSTPTKVEKEIKNSFDLYWINESACANCIRRSLEYLMDSENVKKNGINKTGKPFTINLHDRLKSFTKIDSDLLLSIKWIGNEGSHGVVLTKDLLTGYEILEHVLSTIYGKNAKYFKNKALNITKKLAK